MTDHNLWYNGYCDYKEGIYLSPAQGFGGVRSNILSPPQNCPPYIHNDHDEVHDDVNNDVHGNAHDVCDEILDNVHDDHQIKLNLKPKPNFIQN